MAHIWQGFRSGLRSGEWLTASRMRAYCLILLGLLLFVLTFIVLACARLMLLRLEKKAGN